jgi:patatin-like phospholipase
MNEAAPSPSADSPRDRHLFGPGPKRLLSLDGGGVRGALTVAFLERIEALLSEHHGRDVRLGDHFDLIGGTSTGAIIAGALALGFRTEQVKHFYLKLAPFAFKRQRWSIPLLQAKFDARGLRQQIEEVVGNRLLSSPELITGFCLITKRMDTGSPWIVSNNPRAPYWEDGKDYIGNKSYPLVNLVRASTAAPHFFDPELLPISQNLTTLPDDIAKPLNVPLPARLLQALLRRVGLSKPVKIDPNVYGLFVDGGVTPHNNPALALFNIATLSPFNIKWPTGPERLTVMSLGTGTYRPRLSYESLGFARFTKLALHALVSMMTDAENLVLAMMQWMGECPAPWIINSEVGTLAADAPPGGKLFRFLRYDVRLEREWLKRELNYEASDELIERLRGMDDPALVHQLHEIGTLAAAKQVKIEHFITETAPSAT